MTDRRTSCYGIVRAMHTRRAVKMHLAYNGVQKVDNVKVESVQRRRLIAY